MENPQCNNITVSTANKGVTEIQPTLSNLAKPSSISTSRRHSNHTKSQQKLEAPTQITSLQTENPKRKTSEFVGASNLHGELPGGRDDKRSQPVHSAPAIPVQTLQHCKADGYAQTNRSVNIKQPEKPVRYDDLCARCTDTNSETSGRGRKSERSASLK